MSSEWREVTLEEVTTLLGDGLHGTPNYDETGDYYFINGRNLNEGKIILDEKTKRANEEEYLKYKKDLNDRTILVSINGTLGNIAFYNNEKVFLGKSACYFNVNDEVEKEFIYYVLKNDVFQNHIDREATGTTIKNVSLKTMRGFLFKLPPLETQEEIVSILGSIDQKIHLNQQTNETLEAVAQAIFKSWFVDFDPVCAKMEATTADRDPNRAAMAAISGISLEQGWDEVESALDQKLSNMTEEQRQQLTRTAELFPDELVESEIGEVPKGWGIKPFKDICEDIQSGGTPKRSETEYWGEGYPWLSSGEIRNRYLLKSEEQITEKGLTESNAKLWPSGSTIIAMYGATAGVTAYLVKEMCANQACCCLIPNKNSVFVFISALRASRELSGKSTGSAQQNLNKGIIESHKVLVPNHEVTEAFESIASFLIEKIIANENQNSSLSELRDALLPQLISGEIKLN